MDQPKQSMGSRFGRAILGTLVAGALGPGAVKVGAGMADIYNKGKEKERRDTVLKQLAAAETEQRKAAAEEKKREAAEKSALKQSENSRKSLHCHYLLPSRRFSAKLEYAQGELDGKP
jgi:hypothetical protein